jgi:hypothetical protein
MEVKKNSYRFFIETMRRNGETPAAIHQYLTTAWKEEAPSRSTVFRTYSELQSGARTSFSDGEHSGRPKTVCNREMTEAVEKLVAENPRITIEEITEETGVSHGSAYTILTVYLQLSSRCSRWVPHCLSDEQKLKRVEAANEWLNLCENKSDVELIQRIVVIDEKYFFHRSLGTKQSNYSWCLDASERPRVPRRTMSDSKSHVICATSFCGRFHFEVVEGKSVNSDVYIAFLTEMHQKFVHERQSLGWKKMILIQDNARPHTSKKTMDFLAAKGVQLLKQPPYSPDFNLCDRWLFGTMERIRNHRNFASSDDLAVFLQEAMTGLGKEAQKNQFQHLKHDLTKIVDVAGDYL